MKLKIILLGFSIVWASCENKQISSLYLSQMNALLDQNIVSSKKQYEDFFRRTENLLKEPQRKKYRFLEAAMEQQRKFYLSFSDSLVAQSPILKQRKLEFEEKKKLMESLLKRLGNIDNSVLQLYHETISLNQKAIGLRKYEVENRIENSKTNLRILSQKVDPIISEEIRNDSLFFYQIKLFQYSVLERVHMFGQLLGELIGGNAPCGPTVFFPIVFPKKSLYRKGDYYEADIYIGSPHLDYYEESFGAIIVNQKDTILIDKKTGKANLKIKATESGKFNLNLEANLSNDLTGEIIRYGITHKYYVHE